MHARNIRRAGKKLFKVFALKRSLFIGTEKFADPVSFDEFHDFKLLFVWRKKLKLVNHPSLTFSR